jgi:hypothetical protein
LEVDLHPPLDIATPCLVHVCDVLAQLAPVVEVGRSARGERRVIPITGGEVRGPRLAGRILPGGADFQLIDADGLAEIHARYVIETTSGARAYVENSGMRHGPAELIARQRQGEIVDPSQIYFRATPRFETAAPDLAWLMRSIFVCSGARLPDRVQLRFFEVT